MNIEKLREKALWGVIQEMADDNVGIYPAAVKGGKKPYKKRTKWMDGWNAACSKFSEEATKTADWFANLPKEYKTIIEDLFIEEKIGYWNQTMYITCNDTFFWGCSDCEPITFEELPELIECYKLSPKFGGELWVARKRKMRPQGASYKECYPKEEWPLFDACGLPREAKIGNPIDREKLL
jgi:hypothetical protein